MSFLPQRLSGLEIEVFWTEEDARCAAAEGWRLVDQENHLEGRVVWLDISISGTSPFSTSDQVCAHVARLAAAGSDLHLRALSLVRDGCFAEWQDVCQVLTECGEDLPVELS